MWRKDLDASRRELDGQRQPVEPDADLGDDSRVLVGDNEVGLDGPDALQKERRRIALSEQIGGGTSRFSRQSQWSNGKLLFTCYTKRLPAGRQNADSRADRQKVGNFRRRADHLLKIVEQE